METQESQAVKVALAHIDAWGKRDWDTTRALLAPNVHALVTSTHPNYGGSEFTGVDDYMARKINGAQVIEPGSVRIISAIGDADNALILMTMRIGLGPNGTMTTMVRADLTLLDKNQKIKEERDQFFLLSN